MSDVRRPRRRPESNPRPLAKTSSNIEHLLYFDGFIVLRYDEALGVIMYYGIYVIRQSVRQMWYLLYYQVKSWCNVEYRRFPFENYPAHVKDDLHNCAFKAILEYVSILSYNTT